jgi:penicillin-binding protein 1A
MYLNQFDFLYNAVGIENAAKVYFNKKPKNLAKEEAAMLVGMCKNPALYNPYSFKIRNYRRIIATEKEISPSAVSTEEIAARRAADSTRALNRRTLILAHRVELLQQTADKMRSIWPDAEISMLNRRNRQFDAQVASGPWAEEPD